MCGLQLMAVSCWFYCTKKQQSNKLKNRRKYKEPDELEHQTLDQTKQIVNVQYLCKERV